jgi:hypothetical protein
MKWIDGKLVALAFVFLIVGAIVYKYTFDMQRSSQAIYVVLHNEIDYANNYYNGVKVGGLGTKSEPTGVLKVHVHDFSIEVGSGETYRGRSFLYNGSVIIVVDLPKPSGWLITDPSGRKPGECKKLFGSDGVEKALNMRWKNICGLSPI